MIKKSEPTTKIDLGVIFESTLLGVFVFIGRYFNTLYLFTKTPGLFTGALDTTGQTNAVKKLAIVRPLTFFTISLGLLIVANITVNRARGNSADIHRFEGGGGFNVIYSFYLDALKTFDVQKIVLALSPWVLVAGLFSYLLLRSALKRGLQFSFEKSIGLSAYFCGSTAYAVIAPAPLLIFLYFNTELDSNAQYKAWVGWVWLGIIVLLGLRYFHAYLSILREELGTNMTKSLLVWGGGLLRFSIALVIILELVGYLLTPLLTVAETKWRPLAEQGNAEAQYELGVAYSTGQGVRANDKEAFLWYQEAADQGYVKAHFELGVAYANGYGVQKNETEAVKWYKKAAEQGYAAAQNNLGFAYSSGFGIARNDVEAVRWYRRAAEQGDAMGQFNLGLAYADGQGVRRNDAQAVKWYRMAAEQGHEGAQNLLGIAYANGLGVKQNKVLAFMFFQIAASSGDRDSVQNRDELQSQLSSTDFKTATELAAKWKPGTPLPAGE